PISPSFSTYPPRSPPSAAGAEAESKKCSKIAHFRTAWCRSTSTPRRSSLVTAWSTWRGSARRPTWRSAFFRPFSRPFRASAREDSLTCPRSELRPIVRGMRALFLGLVLVACGSATPEPRPVAKVAPKPAPSTAPAPSRPKGTLKRAEVVAFVNGGFWNFLQQVEVEPSLDDGRFRGWVIVALKPPDFWQGVDLAPGDVVTSVNQ